MHDKELTGILYSSKKQANFAYDDIELFIMKNKTSSINKLQKTAENRAPKLRQRLNSRLPALSSHTKSLQKLKDNQFSTLANPLKSKGAALDPLQKRHLNSLNNLANNEQEGIVLAKANKIKQLPFQNVPAIIKTSKVDIGSSINKNKLQAYNVKPKASQEMSPSQKVDQKGSPRQGRKKANGIKKLQQQKARMMQEILHQMSGRQLHRKQIVIPSLPEVPKKIDGFWWNMVEVLLVSLSFHIQNTAEQKNCLKVCRGCGIAYANMDSNCRSMETKILSYFNDKIHHYLLVESFFYEKVIFYNAIYQEQRPIDAANRLQKYTLSSIKQVREIRSLLISIIQEVGEEDNDEKIFKTKYIAKEKKFIQIKKLVAILKDRFILYFGTGSFFNPHPYGFSDYNSLLKLILKWRTFILKVPMPPYLPEWKGYTLLIEPEPFFYCQNNKTETVTITPFCAQFFRKLNSLAKIVVFTCRKKTEIEVFLKYVEGQLKEPLQVLDRHYLSFRNGRQIKDVSLIGIDPTKCLVMDANFQQLIDKEYHPQCFPLELWKMHDIQLGELADQIKDLIQAGQSLEIEKLMGAQSEA